MVLRVVELAHRGRNFPLSGGIDRYRERAVIERIRRRPYEPDEVQLHIAHRAK